MYKNNKLQLYTECTKLNNKILLVYFMNKNKTKMLHKHFIIMLHEKKIHSISNVFISNTNLTLLRELNILQILWLCFTVTQYLLN